jgi:hypothetical protein
MPVTDFAFRGRESVWVGMRNGVYGVGLFGKSMHREGV